MHEIFNMDMERMTSLYILFTQVDKVKRQFPFVHLFVSLLIGLNKNTIKSCSFVQKLRAHQVFSSFWILAKLAEILSCKCY